MHIIYILALAVYVGFACFILLSAAIMALVPSSRFQAKQMAAGIIGSFPSVFIHQLLSIPLLMAVAGIAFIVVQYGGTDYVPTAMISLGVFWFMIFFFSSLRGAVVGWQIASSMVSGQRFVALINNDELYGKLYRISVAIRHKYEALLLHE